MSWFLSLFLKDAFADSNIPGCWWLPPRVFSRHRLLAPGFATTKQELLQLLNLCGWFVFFPSGYFREFLCVFSVLWFHKNVSRCEFVCLSCWDLLQLVYLRTASFKYSVDVSIFFQIPPLLCNLRYLLLRQGFHPCYPLSLFADVS